MQQTRIKISKQRLLRQYLRWLPFQMGCINKAAFMHQLKEIRKEDVFIVSFPKSGNSWLRYLLAYLIKPSAEELSTKEVNSIVPDVYIAKDLIDEMQSPRYIKSHDLFLNDYPNTIYIHRHPADVFISYYHFQRNIGAFNGSFCHFIQSKEYARTFGTWTNHVEKALKFKTDFPERILIIRYDQLKENFEEEVKNIVSFCKFNSKIDIGFLKKKTSFEVLKNTENTKGTFMQEESGNNFFRSAGTDDKTIYYTEEIINEIMKEKGMKELHLKLGYSLDYYLHP